ncbi:YybH family protein [Cognatilysobacter tabacisoli]|uniref:YybH family protein n=1 Tax=Cognatilysobacter tabacisoli TaxID=2315424 RepID=UPI000E6AE571|nr:DUF4440 domain-containing protein [Lysobacter tabacisoli]
MSAIRLLPAVLLALVVPTALAHDAPAAPPTPRFSADECAVWARELSFARSVADRDAAAFAAHVHADAAFGSGRPVPMRGREAITRGWATIIAGEKVRLRWYPTRVTVAPGVGDVAWSSGPSLFEDLAPGANPRYSIGAFHSVWHKDADGTWRVLFDDGVEGKPATQAQVDAFLAGRREACTPA